MSAKFAKHLPELLWYPAGAFIMGTQKDVIPTTCAIPEWVRLLQPLLQADWV